MNISNITIENGLFLAPMAGITDKSFRALCKNFGAGLTTTEMVSVKGLYYNSKNTFKLLEISSCEKPCAVQLFGHEPEIFKAVLKSGVLDKFDIIDINMGCPAPKIVKNGDGSALMKNLDLASQIIKACVASTTKPVTVKFRKGFKKNDDKLIEFAKMCEESGANAITIHPRTREDMFSGTIDLNDIKKVKESVSIPVIGNGDVVDICSYEQMSQVCDGVMIGRGAFKRPEIFSEIINSQTTNLNGQQDISDNAHINLTSEQNKLNAKPNNLTGGKNVLIEKQNNLEQETQKLKIPTKLEIIKMHLNLLKENYGESESAKRYIAKIFKKYVLSYLGGVANANTIKCKIVLIENLDEIQNLLEEFFKEKI